MDQTVSRPFVFLRSSYYSGYVVIWSGNWVFAMYL
jgi:hypothetical protein